MKTNFTISLKVLSTLFILACSNLVFAQIPNPPVAKPAIPGVVSNVWNFNATWSTVTEATGYQLDVSTDNFSTFITGYNSKSKANTADFISGLAAGTTYKFRVRATNGSGTSANSNVVEVTTGASGSLQTVVPKAGKNVSSTGFTAEWNKMTGATGYQLDISADNFATFLAGYNSKAIAGENTLTEIVTSLTPTTTYQYRLRTVNASGTSANSAVINVTTLDATPNLSDMLDITFDTDGMATSSVGAQDNLFSIAVQSDGKIVAAGTASISSIQRFALARFNTDGSLDNTFGTGGIVTPAIPASTMDGAGAVLIQSDGKIVAAGYTLNSTADFVAIRFNANGTLDTSFDTDGIAIAPIGAGHDFGGALLIQTDGKIVVAGSAQISTVAHFGLARFNANGSLDNTFDTDGVTITTFGTATSSIKSIVVQTDGKIVASGTGGDGFALTRYSSNGSLDNTFDVDGKITSDAGTGKSVVLQTDGKILVTVEANKVFGLVRYTGDGILDDAFGTSGKVITQFIGDAVPSSLVVQPDGKIVVGGSATLPTTLYADFALARYNTNGSIDNTFGTGGKIYTDMGSGINTITSLALQADGKILAGGIFNAGTTSDFGLARYDNAALPATPAPVATAATATSSTGFTANWNAVSGATGYRLDVSDNNFTSFIPGFNDKAVTNTSDVVTGLTSSIAYKYRVRAVDANGTSVNSNIIDVTTLSATLAAPVAITATVVTSSGFNANWNAVAGATGYRLDVSADNFSTFIAGFNDKTVTTVSDVVTGLTAGTTYKYRVRAVDANGTSVNSNVIDVTTLAKQNQTITFAIIADKTLGDAPFALAASASSTLPVTYATTSDKITISAGQVTMVKAGRATITASQAGNATFNAATSVDQSFCIKPAKPAMVVGGINTETLTLTSSSPSGNQWFKDDTAIVGATNTTLSVTAEGVYKVQVKVDDCTSTFSDNVPLIVTGDLTKQLSNFTIYPNPVEEYLHVLGVKGEIRNSQLFDMTGRSNFIQLERREDVYFGNAQDLSPGVYILRVVEGNTIRQIKFIKK